ncbi:MAG: hypothetical protein ACLGHJ_06315 [Gammaproteobacteria bacterium]
MKKLLSPALLVLSAAVSLAPVATFAADPAKPAAAKPAKPAAKSAAKPAAKKSAKPADKAAATPADPQADVPQEVRDEMSALVEKAVQIASAPLQEGDFFLPYGVLQLKSGELKQVQWKQPNPPVAQEVLKGIVVTMMREIAQNPDIIAGVTVGPTMATGTTQTGETMPVHGISALVDHRHGAPRQMFMPYVREDGKINFGTTVYQLGALPLFDHGQAAAAKPADAPAPAATPASASATPAAETATP